MQSWAVKINRAPGNIQENNSVIFLPATSVDNNWWIGLNDIDSEGDFTWPELGNSGDYFNWASVEPNNMGNEDCAVIANHRDYQWNDVPCETIVLPFVCERGLIL